MRYTLQCHLHIPRVKKLVKYAYVKSVCFCNNYVKEISLKKLPKSSRNKSMSKVVYESCKCEPYASSWNFLKYVKTIMFIFLATLDTTYH